MENEEVTKLEELVDEILKLYEERKEKNKEHIEFRRTLGTIHEMDFLSKSLSKKIEQLPQVESILEMYAERTKLQSDFQELRSADRELTNISKQQFEYEVLIEEKETKFHKLMPETCPLCGK